MTSKNWSQCQGQYIGHTCNLISIMHQSFVTIPSPLVLGRLRHCHENELEFLWGNACGYAGLKVKVPAIPGKIMLWLQTTSVSLSCTLIFRHTCTYIYLNAKEMQQFTFSFSSIFSISRYF